MCHWTFIVSISSLFANTHPATLVPTPDRPSLWTQGPATPASAQIKCILRLRYLLLKRDKRMVFNSVGTCLSPPLTLFPSSVCSVPVLPVLMGAFGLVMSQSKFATEGFGSLLDAPVLLSGSRLVVIVAGKGPGLYIAPTLLAVFGIPPTRLMSVTDFYKF